MELGKVLGGGGFGIVYNAKLLETGEVVAVKRLMVGTNTDFIVSYSEMDITAKMIHPNILTLRRFYNTNIYPIQWGTAPSEGARNDQIALIFEVAECNLSSYCRQTLISEHQAQKIITQLLMAVEHIHYHGYLHLDIKPRNILMLKDGSIKLCDFGLSKKYYRYDLQHQGVGSTFYTAPEVMAYDPVYDYSADIWSVGCVLHCMMSGKYVPYVKGSVKVVRDEPSKMGTQLYSYLKNYEWKDQLQDLVRGLPYDITIPEYFTDPIYKEINYNNHIRIEDFFSGTTSLKDPNEYADFLFSILQFAPSHRATASQLLSHTYLQKFESVIIQTVNESRKDSFDEVGEIRIPEKNLREPIVRVALEFLVEARKFEWYMGRDEILFTAIMLYDRFVIKAIKNDVVFDERSCKMYFRGCLYVTTKYYSSTFYNQDLTYDNFPLKKYSADSLEYGAAVEQYIYATVVFIYQVSPYDVMRDEYRSNVLDRFLLLMYFLNLRFLKAGATVYTIYEDWESNKKTQRIQLKGNSFYEIINSFKE